MLCALLGISRAAAAQQAGPQEKQPAAAGSGVLLDGHLTQDYARSGDSLRFWISIENRGTTEISDIRLVDLYAPGFTLAPWCAERSTACGPAPGAGDDCSPPAKSAAGAVPDGSLLCVSLAPGEAITIRGDLIAGAPQPEHNIYAEISWAAGPAGEKNLPRSTKAIALGEGEAVGWLTYWLRRLPSQPLVAIPIIVALVTAFFTWLTKRFEQRALTWSSTMLVEAHKAAVGYYMPVGSHAGAAVSFLKVYRSAYDAAAGGALLDRDVQTLKRAYFHMAMFQWWYWQTFLNESAFHLKDRTAERLIQLLYGRHAQLFGINRVPVRCLLERIQGPLKKDMTLNEFLQGMSPSRTDISRGWRLFQKWARRPACPADVEVLEGFLSLLIYEVNRPNLHWYGHLAPLRASPRLREILVALGPSQPWRARRKWRASVEEYAVRAKVLTRGDWWSWIQKARYWAGYPIRAAVRLFRS